MFVGWIEYKNKSIPDLTEETRTHCGNSFNLLSLNMQSTINAVIELFTNTLTDLCIFVNIGVNVSLYIYAAIFKPQNHMDCGIAIFVKVKINSL